MAVRKTFRVVASPDDTFDLDLERTLRDGGDADLEHQKVREGVWLIRTSDSTSTAAAKRLGITESKAALVVTAQYIAGWAETGIIEQLDAWDKER